MMDLRRYANIQDCNVIWKLSGYNIPGPSLSLVCQCPFLLYVSKQAEVQEGRAKVAEKLNKWKLEDIHRLMDMLDLARGSGSKVKPNPPVTPF